MLAAPSNAAPQTAAAARLSRRFTVYARLRSFVDAFRGVVLLVRTQHNAWIHAGASLGVCSAGWVFGISRSDWCAVVLAMGIVWTAEAINTALELLADEVSLAPRELIGKAKDVAAGAVLLSSVAAAIVGALVFGPHILTIVGAR